MTDKAKQLIARLQTHAKFPFLIKVTHAAFDSQLYISNSDEDITYSGNVYKAACFTIDPPDKDNSKIGDGQLTISAVDQFWIEKIRTSQTAANIKFLAMIIYDEGAVSGVEPIDEIDFTLRAANWSEESIVWTMVFDENMAISVPCDRIGAIKCPGAA